MALVIGGAWVVAVHGQCLGLGGACVPWWPVLGLWPGCWVLGGVVVVVIDGLGGGVWPALVVCPGA